MARYKIVAQATGETPDKWDWSHQIPTFWVEANSEGEAEAVASIILGASHETGTVRRGTTLHIDALYLEEDQPCNSPS